MRELSQELSRELGGSIIENETGLKGNYDFKLQWTQGASQALAGEHQGTANSPSRDSSRFALFAALQARVAIRPQSSFLRAPDLSCLVKVGQGNNRYKTIEEFLPEAAE